MKDEAGVSPVIGTLLVFAMFTTVTATVLVVTRPEISAVQERGEFDTVTTQMSAVAGEVQRLAIASDKDELRQPRLVLPRGTLQVQDGHTYAMTVGFLDPDYEDVDGQNATAWDHYYPKLNAGWASDMTNMPVTLYHNGIGPGVSYSWKMERFSNNVGWVETGTGDELLSMWPSGQTRQFAYDPGNGRQADAVYRFTATQHQNLDEIRFEIYVYDQQRITYHFDGRSGERELLLENGALFRERDGRLGLVNEGVLKSPNRELSTDVYTHRVANVSTDEPVSVSGRSKLGLLMHVDGLYPFDYNRGGVFVRLQVEGPNDAAWLAHLANEGFTAEADPDDGVYYVEPGDPGKHEAFPFNFVWTDIDLQVRRS